jgi:ankyrin repeat protein
MAVIENPTQFSACFNRIEPLGNLPMTKRQLKQGQRPGVDRLGRIPLHYAAADGNVQEVARLLNEGTDVNAQDDKGWSPLHFAAQANSSDVASLLISVGAKVDVADVNGNTPLAGAVFNSRGDGKLIDVLRRAGADPHKVNNYNVSPVSLARQIANFDVARFFKDLP